MVFDGFPWFFKGFPMFFLDVPSEQTAFQPFLACAWLVEACALHFLASMEKRRLLGGCAAAMAVCSRAGRWLEVLELAERLGVADVVDRGSGLGVALMECEQRGLRLAQRRLLRRLVDDVAPAAGVALRFSARLARRVAGRRRDGHVAPGGGDLDPWHAPGAAGRRQADVALPPSSGHAEVRHQQGSCR